MARHPVVQHKNLHDDKHQPLASSTSFLFVVVLLYDYYCYVDSFNLCHPYEYMAVG